MPKKFCKNGHAIENEEGRVIILQSIVLSCTRCGNNFTLAQLPVRYLQDMEYPSGETAHIYTFLYPMRCLSCGASISNIASTCVPFETSEETYDDAIAAGLMPNSFVRN